MTLQTRSILIEMERII